MIIRKIRKSSQCKIKMIRGRLNVYKSAKIYLMMIVRSYCRIFRRLYNINNPLNDKLIYSFKLFYSSLLIDMDLKLLSLDKQMTEINLGSRVGVASPNSVSIKHSN